jgi:hypothetical protein
LGKTTPDDFGPPVLTERRSYFALDIANRVFHERQMKFPTAYIGIDVAMGSLPSLADGLLMLYLKAYSPVDTECAGPFVTIAMIFAFVFYWLSSVAAKGTQIWSLIAQKATGTGNGGFKSSGGYSNLAAKALRIYRDVYSAATGMHLLFAISFALASVAFLRQRSKNQTLHNGPYLAIAILAASFLVRGVFDFVITFIYRQNGYVSLIIQLIFMATYGILSVVIYACIVSMAAAQKKQNALPGKVKPNEAAQTLFSEGVDTWERTAGLQSQGL